MKTVSATEAKQRFAALIDAAQREPVLIQRQNRDVAVIISPEDYKRLREFRVDEFLRVTEETSRIATANGMTEEILAEILADPTDD